MNGTRSLPNISNACHRYLFKNYLDAALYQVVYLIFPLYSLGIGAFFNYETAYLTALPCCIGVIYDSISRYDKEGYQQKFRKIATIIIINALLTAYTIGVVLCFAITEVNGCLWIYLLLLIAPIIGAYDLGQMILEDGRSRRK